MADTAADKLKRAVESSLLSIKSSRQAAIIAASGAGGVKLACEVTAALETSNAITTLEKTLVIWDNVLNGIKATQELGGINGIIEEVITTEVGNVAATQQGDSTPVASNTATPKITPNEHGICMSSATTLKEPTQTPEDTGTAKTLNVFGLKALNKTTGGQGSHIVCCLGSAGPVSAATTCTTTYTAIGYRGGGKVLRSSAITVTKKNKATGEEYTATADTKDVIPSAKAINSMATKLAAMEAAVSKIKEASTIDTKDSLDSTEAKDAIARFTSSDKADYSKNKDVVDKFISADFWEDGKIIKEQLAQFEKDLKPPKVATGSEKEETLTAMTDNDALKKAQLYYTVAALVREQEEKKKNQENPSCPTKTDKTTTEPKKTADECKKHTTAGDCEKEKGCDFDEKKDPKCFPKENLSTKTIGRKSFVI
uniref:Variant surface glycoprotein 1125.4942 n=1 Tax=Trypanosoma brucei TaxID=5691 RepID=A0A1J0RBA1_9TRYP|nr:variant surface glycoprotein 1125.4942 [Trypanosoma brucei]